MTIKNQKISNEIKAIICNMYFNGDKAVKIASALNLKRTTIFGIIKKFITFDKIESDRAKNKRPAKITEEQKNLVRTWVDEDCSISLKALTLKFANTFHITISKSTIDRILYNFHYSIKRVNLLPIRRNSEDNIITKKDYAIDFIRLQATYSENDFIFIDETGFNVSMRSSYGRSFIGTPAIKNIANLRSNNISVCCAMNKLGILHYSSQNRAYNGNTFFNFLNELIGICREKNLINSIFILDNVRFHKVSDVVELVSSSGFRIKFLPPYSPFLNPIENMFSKWKDFAKRENPSNENHLLEIIESGSRIITSEDCNGFYRNMMFYILRCLNDEIIED